MTAYGRFSVSGDLAEIDVQIQTLNRKFLDVHVKLPKELLFFDIEIRKWIASQIQRGKVTVTISAKFGEDSPVSVTPNISLAHQIKLAWEKITNELQLEETKECVLQLLANQPSIFLYQESSEGLDKFRPILREGVFKALEAVQVMKIDEGTVIQKDFVSRFSKLSELITSIEKNTQGSEEKYRKQLLKNITDLLPNLADNEDRILREICILAGKVDISEEIIRFRSHLTQVMKLITSENEGIGKTLEFLLQELLREVNTIGSKSMNMEISKLVIAIKSELEKVREQVQNIE